jgi:threonine 3-dehydrogenase
MKALVKAEAGPGLRLEDVPVPVLGRDDVLIRVLRTGVCGTDLHICDWDGWARENVLVPLVVGHEFAGEVVEIGSDVQELRQGDLVSGEGHLVCGRCRNCMAGRRVQCARTKGVGSTTRVPSLSTLRCPLRTCGGTSWASTSTLFSTLSATRCTRP